MKIFIRTFLLGIFGLVLALMPFSVQAAVQDLAIGTYTLVSQQRVNRTEYNYTYSTSITNNGAEGLQNVKGTLASTSPHTTIVDGEVTFGDIAGENSAGGMDTFTIKHNRLYPFDSGSLVWSFSGEAIPILDFSITGSVVSVNTRRPKLLSGVKVRAGGLESITDEEGHFSIEGIGQRSFLLEVNGWDVKGGPFARTHYDIEIPDGQSTMDKLVRLPLIGPLNSVAIDEAMAQLTNHVDGSATAVLKADVIVPAEYNGKKAKLMLGKGSTLYFQPGISKQISLTHVGLAGLPEPLPNYTAIGHPFITENVFTIQPEGISFSTSPHLVFEDADGAPIGSAYKVFRYGSYTDCTPPEEPTKQPDGTIEVDSGITESGTYALPYKLEDVIPSDWKTTTITGRVVIQDANGNKTPVPNATVHAMSAATETGSDGRFSLQAVCKPPGAENPFCDMEPTCTECYWIQLVVIAEHGEEGYTGHIYEKAAEPDGLKDVGDIVLSRFIDIVEMHPQFGYPGVDPVDLQYPPGVYGSVGIKYVFSERILGPDTDLPWTEERDRPELYVTVMPIPMFESLYEKRELVVPLNEWMNVAADQYAVALENDDLVDAYGCEMPGCDEDPDEETYGEAYCEEHKDDGTKYFNTLTLDLSPYYGDGPYVGSIHNTSFLLYMSELSAGIRGKNGEMLYCPDISSFLLDDLFGEAMMLLGYYGEPPEMRQFFATMEDPQAKKSPVLGLLIPDENGQNGYQWHDSDTLTAETVIEVDPGTTIRIQAEDGTFMKRIVAEFGDETFNQTVMEDDEKPFLMHLEIPVPEDIGSDPVPLKVFAEGLMYDLVNYYQLPEAHKTGFEVKIQPQVEKPTITEINPNAIYAGVPASLQITGENLGATHTVKMVSPDGTTESPLAFTIQGDALIETSAFTFSIEGLYRIVVIADSGQDEASVLVVAPIPGPRSATGGNGGVSYSWCDNQPHELTTDGKLIYPELGRNYLEFFCELPGDGSLGMSCQLNIPVGVLGRASELEICTTSGAAQGRFLYPAIDARLHGEGNLNFQEVLSIQGVERSDGTLETTGTVRCHLELTGTASKTGWLSNARGAYAIYDDAFSIAVPATSTAILEMTQNPLKNIENLTTPLSVVELGLTTHLSVLPDAQLWPDDPSNGNVNMDVHIVSDSFDLPVPGEYVFFRPAPYPVKFRNDCSVLDGIGGSMSVNLNFKLVCEDKLIYSK